MATRARVYTSAWAWTALPLVDSGFGPLRAARRASRLGSTRRPGAQLLARRLPCAGRRMGQACRACGRVGNAVGVRLAHMPPERWRGWGLS
jgi:hypothetical protein